MEYDTTLHQMRQGSYAWTIFGPVMGKQQKYI